MTYKEKRETIITQQKPIKLDMVNPELASRILQSMGDMVPDVWDWNNLNLAFIGSGAWSIFQFIEKEKIISSRVFVFDTGHYLKMEQYVIDQSEKDRKNIRLISNPFRVEIGTGRNPFISRVLVSHFKEHFSSELEIKTSKDLLFIGCPGGGFNSLVIPDLAHMRASLLGNACLAVLPGPKTSDDWYIVSINQIIALYYLFLRFSAIFMIDADYVSDLVSSNNLNAHDWKDGLAKFCAMVINFINIYIESTWNGVHYRRNLADLAITKYYLGRKCKIDNEVERILYFMCYPFPLKEKIPWDADPLIHAYQTYTCLENKSPHKKEDIKGIYFILECKSEYFNNNPLARENEIKTNIANLFNIEEDVVNVILRHNSNLEYPVGCIFLASPYLIRFKELANTSYKYEKNAINSWKAGLIELINENNSEIINEAITNCNYHGHFTANINEFYNIIDRQINEIPYIWKRAKEFINNLAEQIDEPSSKRIAPISEGKDKQIDETFGNEAKE